MDPNRVLSNKLNLEAMARRLLTSNLAETWRCAADIRERMEIVHTSEYSSFLSTLFPVFRNLLLKNAAPSLQPDPLEAKVRHILLEILSRLPNTEVLRPYCTELLRLATSVLACDNEENALTCLRIIFDLHKNYRPALEGEVQSFLDLVQQIYRQLSESVHRAFLHTPNSATCQEYVGQSFNGESVRIHEEARQVEASTLQPLGHVRCHTQHVESGYADGMLASSTSLKGMNSFKVLTECPLIVMLLFQLYPKFIQDNIPRLTPLMMGALALRTSPEASETRKDRYRELVACQVKTLSFLTYLLRGFSELMQPYESAIAQAVIALMMCCPADAIATRKELLVATRHILATNFRGGFFEHVDTLLDEEVLLGMGPRTHHALRPLAFSTLADLVHHVRARLNMSQLKSVVFVFSRNVHDPSLPSSVQTTSVRLLLNLVDFIFHNSSADVRCSRRLLVVILESLAAKFNSLRYVLAKIDPAHEVELLDDVDEVHGKSTLGFVRKVLPSIATTLPNSENESAFETHAWQQNRCGYLQGASTYLGESLSAGISKTSDMKPLIQTCFRGLKTVIWCLSNYKMVDLSSVERCVDTKDMTSSAAKDHSRTDATNSTRLNSPCGFNLQTHGTTKPSFEELQVVSNSFCWGLLSCCAYVAAHVPWSESKEVVDNFAGAFTVLHSTDLREAIGPHIPLLYDAMLLFESFIAIAQILLANANISAAFADMLLEFLISKLTDLSHLRCVGSTMHTSQATVFTSSSAFSKAKLKNGSEERNEVLPVFTSISIACITEAANHIAPDVRAARLLHLFRTVLGSVALFPTNEVALRGRLRTLTSACLLHATACRCAIAYCILLRSLFRSASGVLNVSGSPTALLTELDSSTNDVVSTVLLLKMHNRGPSPAGAILTELSLTIPLQMHKFELYLPRLIPILIEALLCDRQDLASLALSSIEYCIDNFGSDWLHKTLARDESARRSVLLGICSHLRPPPYVLGTSSLRVLGKMGGYNRDFLEVGELCLECMRPRETRDDTLNPDMVSAALARFHTRSEEDCVISHHPTMITPFPDQISSLRLVVEWKGIDVSKATHTDTHVEMLRSRMHTGQNCMEVGLSTGNAIHFTLDVSGCIVDVCGLLCNLLGATDRAPILDSASLVLRRYRLLCVRFVASALSCLVDSNPTTQPSGDYSFESSQSSGQSQVSRSYHGSHTIHFSRMCKTLLFACTSSDTRSEAYVFLHALATSCGGLLCVLCDSEIQRWDDPDEARDVHEASDVRAAAFLRSNQGIAPHTLTETCLETMTSGCDGAANCALGVVVQILKSIMGSESRSKHHPTIVSEIAKRCSVHVSCLRPSASGQLSLCNGLRKLVPFFGDKWDAHTKLLLADSLFSLMNACACLLVYHSALQAFLTLLHECFSSIAPSLINLKELVVLPEPGCEPSSIAFLMRKLTHVNPLQRLAAQCALNDISDRMITRAHKEILARTLVGVVRDVACALLLRGPVESSGMLDALCYVLTLHPETLRSNSTLQHTLLRCVNEVRAGTTLDGNRMSVGAELTLVLGKLEWSHPSRGFAAALNIAIHSGGVPLCLTSSDVYLATLMRVLHAMILGSKSCTSKVQSVRSQFGTTTLTRSHNAQDYFPEELQEVSLRLAYQALKSDSRVIVVVAATLLRALVPWSTCPSVTKLHATYVSTQLDSLASLHLNALGGLNHLVQLQGFRLVSRCYIASRVLQCLGAVCKPQLGNDGSRYPDKVLATVTQLLMILSNCNLSCQPLVRNESSTSDADACDRICTCEAIDFGYVIANIVTIEVELGRTTANKAPVITRTAPISISCSDVRAVSRTRVDMQQPARMLYRDEEVKSAVSPLRGPLADLLSRCSLTALDFFFRRDHFASAQFSSLLRQIVGMEAGVGLRMRLLSTHGAVAIRDVLVCSGAGSSTRDPEDSLVEESVDRSLKTTSVGVSNGSHPSPTLVLSGPYHTSHMPRTCELISLRASTRCTGDPGANLKPDCAASSELRNGVGVGSDACDELPGLDAGGRSRTHALELILTLLRLDDSFLYRHPELTALMQRRWRRILFDLQKLEIGSFNAAAAAAAYDRNHRTTTTDLSDDIDARNEVLLQLHTEAHALAQCLVSYCRTRHQDVRILYDLLGIFSTSTPYDYTFLRDFYTNEASVEMSPHVQRASLLVFMRMLQDSRLVREVKALALRLVVTPALLVAFKNWRTERSPLLFVDVNMGAVFVRCALDLVHESQSYNDSLRVELLKFTTVLMECAGDELSDHRKDLIKFAWNHLKAENASARQWAYVSVCRFISTYETPPKIILQVYVALLRMFQPELRDLVRTALDILLPSLPKRLNMPDFVKAIKWTKKIMYEEGHALAQLVHMWQVIVRHPSIFIAHSSQFLPHMINSLNRLGLPPNCPVENRQLAVALADLIIAWESHLAQPKNQYVIDAGLQSPNCMDRVSCSMSTCGDPCEGSVNMPVNPVRSSESHPGTMIEMVANFLVRLSLFASDNKEGSVQRLAPRCMRLLETALLMWPNVHIRFSYFEKLIATSNELPHLHPTSEPPYSARLLATCLSIFIATLRNLDRANTFLVDNMSKAQELICPCIFVPDEEVQTKLRKALSYISIKYPPNQAKVPWSTFYTRVKLLIEDGLLQKLEVMCAELRPPPHVVSSHSPEMCVLGDTRTIDSLSLVRVLGGICEHAPEYLANHATTLLCLAQISLQLHLLSFLGTPEVHPNALCNATPVMGLLSIALGEGLSNHDHQPVKSGVKVDHSTLSVNVIQACVNLLAKAIDARMLRPLRRQVVSLLFVCLVRSESNVLVLAVVEIMSRWLTGLQSPLTKTEKFAFLEHLTSADNHTDAVAQPLFRRFLAVLLRLERKQSSMKHVLKKPWQRILESPVSSLSPGLMSPHSGVRADYRSHLIRGCFDASLSVLRMLQLDWTTMSSRFWLVVGVELLLGYLDLSKPVQLAEPTIMSAKDVCDNNKASGYTDAGSWGQPSDTTPDEHTAALALISSYRCSTACVIKPLSELVHGSIRLSQRLWEQLMVQIPSTIPLGERDAWPAALGRALVYQLTATYHVPQVLVPACCRTCMADVLGFHECLYRLPTCSELLACSSYRLPGVSSSLEQQSWTPENVPQSLIRALRLTRCRVHVWRDAICCLVGNAPRFRLWHDVLALLEAVVVQHSSDATDFLGCIGGLLSELAETDVKAHVFSVYSECDVTAIVKRQYGFMPEAQQLYLRALHDQQMHIRPSESEFSCVSEGPQVRDTATNTDACTKFCVGEWVGCMRDLSQWSVLSDLGLEPSADSGLLACCSAVALEAAWKCRRWDDVRVCLLSKSVTNDLTDLLAKVARVRLAIVDACTDDFDGLCVSCIQHALQSWHDLPSPQLGSAAHDRLLHVFHQLVEVHESGHVLHEVVRSVRTNWCPELRALARVWRRRLPNYCDSLARWDDILYWRNTVFDEMLRSTGLGPDMDRSLISREQAWMHFTYARIARKQRLAQEATFKLHGTEGDMCEGFELFRGACVDQTRSHGTAHHRIVTDPVTWCNQMDQSRIGQQFLDGEPTNDCNDFQQSDLFRLQGVMNVSLRRFRDAHQALSQATSTCNTNGRAWFDWGALCELESRSSDHCQVGIHDALEVVSVSSAERGTFLGNRLVCFAIICYMSAAEHGHKAALVGGVARVLWLLRLFHQEKPVQRAFIGHFYSVPCAAWIPWIPQIVAAVLGRDDVCMRELMMYVSRHHPQAMYYRARATANRGGIVAMRDHRSAFSERSRAICNTVLPKLIRSSSSTQVDLLEKLKRRDTPCATILTNLWLKYMGTIPAMETFCIEVLQGLTPLHDDKLFASLQKVHLVQVNSTEPLDVGPHKISLELTEKLGAMINSSDKSDSQLRRVALRKNHRGLEPSPGLEMSGNKYEDRVSRMMMGFNRDETVRISALRLAISRRRDWMLRYFHAVPPCSLQSCSPVLASFNQACYAIARFRRRARDVEQAQEVPDTEPQHMYLPATHLRLGSLRLLWERIYSFDPYVCNAMLCDRVVRHFCLLTDEGHVRSLASVAVSCKESRALDHISQFMAIADYALARCLLAQRRRLRLSQTLRTELASNLNITSLCPTGVSAADISRSYWGEHQVVHRGHDETQSAMWHVRMLCRTYQRASMGDDRNDSSMILTMASRAVYNHVCKRSPASLLYARASCSLKGADSLWAYRRHVASHVAVMSQLNFVLQLTKPSPDHVVVGKLDGRIQFSQLHSCHLGILPTGRLLDELPFRFGRSIEYVLQPFMLGGSFIPMLGVSFTAIDDVVNETGSVIQPYACLMSADELEISSPRKDVRTADIPSVTAPFLHRVSCTHLSGNTKSAVGAQSQSQDLITAASNPHNLAQMLPFWQPWI